MTQRFVNLGGRTAYFAEPNPGCLCRIEAEEALKVSTQTNRPCENKKSSSVTNQTEILPCEILLKVFKFLPIGDRFAVSKTCKSWSAVVSDAELWNEPIEHEVMPEATKSPKDQFAEVFTFASAIRTARIKFSKEPPSDRTPVAVFSFANLKHVVAKVGLYAEVPLVETLGSFCPDITIIAFQFMQFHDLLVFGYMDKFKK